MMVHVLQHVPHEGLGSLEAWLRQRGATVAWVRPGEGDTLPDPARTDLVIALGGPMGVHEAVEHPWLGDERVFLADAARAGRPVLGLCLGAQLLAAGLGAAVTRGAGPEIGWFPVEAVEQGEGLCPLPAKATMFHWHGDTFALPAGAVHLARSAACLHQGFQWGARAVGLQFHPEATAAAVAAMLTHESAELAAGLAAGEPWVQDVAAIAAGAEAWGPACARAAAAVLDFLVR